jgi:hypothetical protein
MIARMPRLGPSIVPRPKLEEWLGRLRGVPVRFLVAPPGFGKTVGVIGYLRHSAGNGRYCAIPPQANAETLWGQVGRALGSVTAISSHEELVSALAERAPLELALDCERVPDAGGVGAILRLIEELPDEVALLIACRTRVPLQVARLVSQGTASLCDAERLAFDAAEIRNIAEACEVTYTHADVLRMLDATDGWPQVVSGALRKAAEDNCTLAQAFENWRLRHGHLFNEFVGDALSGVSEHEADLVLKLMSGSHLDDHRELQRLEEQGLFVIHTRDGYRPLRALSRTRLYDRYGRRSGSVAPMHVRLFGWFAAEIDRRPIEWIRKRDRQIFKYVALQPGGTISRDELSRAFWPGTERHLATHSLRTACSNIRKAIAQIVGYSEVDAYFRAGDEISVDLSSVVIDVNRFISHADDADEQYARRELRAAYTRYRNAARVYRGDLLIGDAHEPWVGALDAALRERRAVVLKRIAEIAASLDDPAAASPRTGRASAC